MYGLEAGNRCCDRGMVGILGPVFKNNLTTNRRRSSIHLRYIDTVFEK